MDTALRVDRTMDLEECLVIQQRIDNFTTVQIFNKNEQYLNYRNGMFSLS